MLFAFQGLQQFSASSRTPGQWLAGSLVWLGVGVGSWLGLTWLALHLIGYSQAYGLSLAAGAALQALLWQRVVAPGWALPEVATVSGLVFLVRLGLGLLQVALLLALPATLGLGLALLGIGEPGGIGFGQ